MLKIPHDVSSIVSVEFTSSKIHFLSRIRRLINVCLTRYTHDFYLFTTDFLVVPPNLLKSITPLVWAYL